MGAAIRIDPMGCQCTDCATGASVPLGDASDDDLLRLAGGQSANATGEKVELTVRIKVGQFSTEVPARKLNYSRRVEVSARAPDSRSKK